MRPARLRLEETGQEMAPHAHPRAKPEGGQVWTLGSQTDHAEHVGPVETHSALPPGLRTRPTCSASLPNRFTGVERGPVPYYPLIPAEAGTQALTARALAKDWVPASAGMSG